MNRKNIIKNLQYVVVGKFSYDWPEIAELRELIPTHCGIIGECKVDLLRNRHVHAF